MKFITSCILTLFIGSQALAQTAEKDTSWTVGGNFSLTFAQSSFSNWQAGGVNSIAGNSNLFLFADYDKESWTWVNRLRLAYGMNFQEDVFNKTDDQIELESRGDYNITDHWAFSGLLNFRTQFTDGFENPEDAERISGFLAPAYSLVGLGFTYKPSDKFSLFLSPLTMKNTIVNDQTLANDGRYGVTAAERDTAGNIITEGKKVRFEVGAYINLRYKQKVMKNVDLVANVDFYSNYLDGNYEYVDVNGELLLLFKVNEYITANLSFNVIYDHDILFDVDGDGTLDGPRTQMKQVLGMGFAYSFGEKFKE